MAHGPTDAPAVHSLLARYLAHFSTAEQDQIAAALKKQADHYMRTDLDRCLARRRANKKHGRFNRQRPLLRLRAAC